MSHGSVPGRFTIVAGALVTLALSVSVALTQKRLNHMEGVVGSIHTLTNELVTSTHNLTEVITNTVDVCGSNKPASGITLEDLPHTFECTAYEASYVSCGKYADGKVAYASNGTSIPVGLGIAAADWRVLPPGTILHVEEIGRYFIVLDRGGDIKGRRLDLYVESVSRAMKVGRFTSKVSLLRPR